MCVQALICPSIARAAVAELTYTEFHVQKLMERIAQQDGESVDLQPLFFNFTLDNTTDFLFGRSINCQSDPAMNEFSQAFEYVEHALGSRLALGKLARFKRDAHFDQSCKIVHRFVDGYIEDGLSPGKQQRGRRA